MADILLPKYLWGNSRVTSGRNERLEEWACLECPPFKRALTTKTATVIESLNYDTSTRTGAVDLPFIV